jgi:glucose-6-phosphate 1-dehydrogenase
LKPEEVDQRAVRAQYTAGVIDGEPVKGYKEEDNIKPTSTTETFVAIEFQISNWRWAGVPFYVRTGKRLGRNLTEIAVHLKRTPQALFARTPDEQIEPNVIVLRIQPNEGINVSIGAKQPGFEMRTNMVHMDFCYQSEFGVRSPDAYETLLLDAMQGDATLFTRRDEVEAQWRLITPIEEAWAREGKTNLATYPAGSDGPTEADPLLAKNGNRWRRLQDAKAGCD